VERGRHRDFDGDGTGDIPWSSSANEVAIWFMKNGQFSSGLDLGSVPSVWSVIGTGDFDGDGTSDILWRDNTGNVAIWLIKNGQMNTGTTLGQGADHLVGRRHRRFRWRRQSRHSLV
jgi:hypothetical protein